MSERCPKCGFRTGKLRGETPGQKSARLSRMVRLLRDEGLAREMAIHVARDGLTTKQAMARMGIGIVRSQRVRAVAVRLGLLAPRQRGRTPAAKAAGQ